MLKGRTKTVLLWGILIALALGSISVGYGVFIAVLFPFSPALLAVYCILATLFPMLYFHFRKRVFEIISFVLFLLPLLIVVFGLIGFAVGWLEWL